MPAWKAGEGDPGAPGELPPPLPPGERKVVGLLVLRGEPEVFRLPVLLPASLSCGLTPLSILSRVEVNSDRRCSAAPSDCSSSLHTTWDLCMSAIGLMSAGQGGKDLGIDSMDASAEATDAEMER